MDSTRRYSDACIATHVIRVYKWVILGINKTIHVGLVLLDQLLLNVILILFLLFLKLVETFNNENLTLLPIGFVFFG
jgi:hypothetical protein